MCVHIHSHRNHYKYLPPFALRLRNLSKTSPTHRLSPSHQKRDLHRPAKPTTDMEDPSLLDRAYEWDNYYEGDLEKLLPIAKAISATFAEGEDTFLM